MKTKEQVLKESGINWEELRHDLPLLYYNVLRAMESYALEHIRNLSEGIKDETM